jgi:hypothetical protein
VARAEADIAHRADTDGVSVNWLMVAEAQRFPELAAMVACEHRPAEVVGQIAAALEREARADALAIEPRIRRRAVPPARRQLAAGRALGLGTLPPALRLAIAFKISQCSFDFPRLRIACHGCSGANSSGSRCNLRAASLMIRSACRTA